MLSKVTVYVVAKRGWTEFPLLSSALSTLLESLSDGVAVGAGEESEEGVGLVGFWGAVVADGDSDVSGAVEGVDGVAEVFGVAVGEEGVAGFADGLCEIMVLEEVPGFCLSTRAVGRPPPPVPSRAVCALALAALESFVTGSAVAARPVRRLVGRIIASRRPATVDDRICFFRQ